MRAPDSTAAVHALRRRMAAEIARPEVSVALADRFHHIRLQRSRPRATNGSICGKAVADAASAPAPALAERAGMPPAERSSLAPPASSRDLAGAALDVRGVCVHDGAWWSTPPRSIRSEFSRPLSEPIFPFPLQAPRRKSPPVSTSAAATSARPNRSIFPKLSTPAFRCVLY